MNKITKITLLLGLLLITSFFSLKAQTTTYSGTFPITLQAYSQIYQSSATWMGSTSAPSSASRTACYTQTDANFNSGRNLTYQLPRCGTITLKANNGTAGRGMIITVVDGSNNQLLREAFLIANSGCTDKEFVINNNGTTKITFLSPTSATANVGSITAFGSVYLSYINITDYVAATPQITKFVAEGVEATIDQSAKTITAQLPYGSSLTSITPTVTTGGTATDYSPKGAQDFTNPVTYTATDGSNNVDYTVTLTVNPTPSSDKDLSNVTIGGKTPTFDAGTNTYSVMLPKASSLTQTVTFTKPSTATANFTSGNSHDFTNPLQITVTAQDLTTKVYTLTAQVGSKNIAYVINTAVDAKDIKIRPMLASKYYLENIPIANITTTYDFSSYDMVILTEAPSSGSAGMKALWGINKPLLSLKMYAIQANTWNLSTASNPVPSVTTVTVNEPNHPIFNGVTWTGTYGNEIEMFDAISSGNGVQTTPYAGIYNLANVKGLATTGVLELPVGTTSPMSGTTNANLQQKLLFVSISNDNQNIVTNNALKVIDNAVNYLTGSTTWGTDAGTEFKNITPTGYSVVTSNVRAMLYWDAIPGAVKYIISKIGPATVKGINYVKSDVNAEVDGSITEFELLGLNQGTEYTYQVVGQNALGTNSAPKTFNFITWWTGVNNAMINGVTFDGKIIHNADHQLLNVFDATGRLILNSREDINMSAQAKGVYLVKGENGMMKIAVTK